MNADCGTCDHYNKFSRLHPCSLERKGLGCDHERRANWDLRGNKPMTEQEKRELLTRMFGADPGPQYGDTAGYEEFAKKFDAIWNEDEEHGDL